MPNYSEFFLSSPSSVASLETIEISHGSFSKTYRIVRNAINGITATLETGQEVYFEYYPAQISPLGSDETLDQDITVSLGDLGEIIPQEIDFVHRDDSWDEKPVLVYRLFRSDDLSSPMFGPVTLEVENITSNKKGSSIVARAISLNSLKTGEIYDYERFPGLRGFL